MCCDGDKLEENGGPSTQFIFPKIPNRLPMASGCLNRTMVTITCVLVLFLVLCIVSEAQREIWRAADVRFGAENMQQLAALACKDGFG